MDLNSRHPQYDFYIVDWEKMRHTNAGERVVKSHNHLYLPSTSGQREDGYAGDPDAENRGAESYKSYRDRAEFPEYVSESVEKLLGLMHQKPAVFDLPPALQSLLQRVTPSGEDLQSLLRRINEQQLLVGRLGILVDMPRRPTPGTIPHLGLYEAETIADWDVSEDSSADIGSALNYVKLNESSYIRNDAFEWVWEERYRILKLAGETAEDDPEADPNRPVYTAGEFAADETVMDSEMIAPSYKGKKLDVIPFVIVNVKDLVASISKPPLLGLADKCLAIYRKSADYNQNLHMQGQDTLVVKGSTLAQDEVLRTGAGARIDVPEQGDAKYVGVTSTGLSEQRLAINDAQAEAKEKALQLFKADVASQESGVAIDKRVTSQTATLNQIVLAGAKGLELALRHIAQWIGENPDEVIVTPNMEFVNFEITGQEWMQLQTARRMGLPLSQKSIHSCLVDRGLTGMTYEAELAQLKLETDLALDEGGGADA